MSSTETFLTTPFAGEAHRWLDFKQEVLETLQSTNPLSVKFLFPDVPWILNADNIPTNHTINNPELHIYPGLVIPEAGRMQPPAFTSAMAEYNAKLSHNKTAQEALTKIRHVLSSRLSVTIQKKLTPITNYLKLYHFWIELQNTHGNQTITEATQGRDQLNILGRSQLPGEFYTTWLNIVEPEWERFLFTEKIKLGLLLSDGKNKLNLTLITDPLLQEAVKHLNQLPTTTYASAKTYLQNAANQNRNSIIPKPSTSIKAVDSISSDSSSNFKKSKRYHNGQISDASSNSNSTHNRTTDNNNNSNISNNNKGSTIDNNHNVVNINKNANVDDLDTKNKKQYSKRKTVDGDYPKQIQTCQCGEDYIQYRPIERMCVCCYSSFVNKNKTSKINKICESLPEFDEYDVDLDDAEQREFLNRCNLNNYGSLIYSTDETDAIKSIASSGTDVTKKVSFDIDKEDSTSKIDLSSDIDSICKINKVSISHHTTYTNPKQDSDYDDDDDDDDFLYISDKKGNTDFSLKKVE